MSLEPTDVGPRAGGDLRASDADRRRVTDLLQAACADGRLSPDERDQRVAAATTAVTFDDLVPLTRDLVRLDTNVSPTLTSAPRAAVPAVVDAAGAEAASETKVAFFGTHKRTGRYRVRKHTGSLTIFGDTVLDLTQATFDAETVELEVFCLFGDVKLIVPAGVRVVNDTVAAFADATVKGLDETVPGPTIRIKGLCLFGDVSAIGPEHKSFWKRLKRLAG